jgi:hypothetical protein
MITPGTFVNGVILNLGLDPGATKSILSAKVAKEHKGHNTPEINV